MLLHRDDWVKRKAEADALRKQQALAWAHKQREAAAAAAAAREAERQALKERESKWWVQGAVYLMLHDG